MNEQHRPLPTATATSAEGVLLGAAVGDALGWPQEFRGQIVGGQRARDALTPQPRFVAWERNSGHYTSKRRDRVGAGEYSDDTQLLLATARASLRGDAWLAWLTGVELPVWPLYQRGGGGAVLTACAAWTAGRAPWLGADARAKKARERYAGAGANGVAMRIAPHVLVEPDRQVALARVLQDGLQTHGHPRALLGALVYAAALHTALREPNTLAYGQLLDAAEGGLLPAEQAQQFFPDNWPEDLRRQTTGQWAQVIEEVRDLLARSRRSLDQGAMSHPEKLLIDLGCDDPKVNGAGTITAVAAIFLASRFAARPMSGLLQAAFLRRGDTDTLASMTGALLGALHGTDWLEGLELQVQDASYLAWIGGRLVGATPASDVAIAPPNDIARLRDRMLRDLEQLDARRGQRLSGRFPDGRSWHLVKIDGSDESNPRAVLRLEDGQTVFVELPKRTHPRPVAAAEREQTGAGHRACVPTAAAATLRSGISLPTSDLKRAATFYAALLGREVPTHGQAVRITDWLTLRLGATNHQATECLLRFEVHDLDAAARALQLAPGDQVLRARDPDGRRIEVFRAPAQPPTAGE